MLNLFGYGIMKMKDKIQPFVAWAGGKSQLLPEIESEIKRAGQFDTYYEPFVGGGAVLFDLLPKKAVINDYNEELINAYKIIQINVEKLIKELANYKNTAEDYYAIRALDRKSDYQKLDNIKKAARFIYLNKTSYNALYRVNKKGYFNAAYGKRKKAQILNKSNLMLVHEYLSDNQTTIYNNDFAEVLEKVEPNSLVYLDPPYVPLTDTANFTGYTANRFNKADQERLAKACQHLDEIGAKFIASNSDTKLVHELYQQFNIRTVYAKRYINVNGKKRNNIKELLITNF